MLKAMVLISILGLVVLAPSYAGTLPVPHWEIGPYLSHITYKEPGVMEEKGWMYGLAGVFDYHNNFMIRLEGYMSCGEVDYDGAYGDGTPLKINGIPDYMWEGRVLGGWDFALGARGKITPYLGYGYRYLNDNAHEENPAGYERESNYYYSPIGIMADLTLDQGWAVGMVLEYDLFYCGLQKSHLSDTSSLYNDIENKQRHGYGLRGSFKVSKEWRKVAVQFEPFIRYWKIQESDSDEMTIWGIPVGEAYEPKNNSTEIGAALKIRF